MLVLSRKPGESLRIDGRVKVTVVSATARHVRLAIEAPEEVEIHREEVYQRIARANLDAARAASAGGEALAAGEGEGGESMSREGSPP